MHLWPRPLTFLILSLSTSISLAGSSSLYRSVQELDRYGSSPQINNAGKTKLHSLPTLVTMCGSSLYIAYLERKQMGILPKQRCNIIGQSHSTDNTMVATISSGVASDASFVNKLLRKDVMNVWERYDAIPDCARVAHTASRIMLSFMGYEDEIHDGSPDVLVDRGERLNIGRPLGIFMIVARVHSDKPVEMRLVEPSGVISDAIAGRVLGKGCGKGNELLKQKWRHNLEHEQIQDLCSSIIKEITMAEYLVGDHGGEDDYNVVIERLDAKLGFTRTTFSFGNIHDII